MPKDEAGVTDDQVRQARHAYLGAVSFVDAQVGLLLETLEQTRLDRRTVVVVLADHGEMLGEHGLWYKMAMREGAARVPLTVAWPGEIAPLVEPRAVSLVDLLPTLVELAHGGRSPTYAAPLDGRSLVPHLQGSGGHDGVLAEYLAEGVNRPMVMLREGHTKFVHCPGDPDQLFDLAADPDETVNLAALAEHGGRVAEFRRRVGELWGLPALEAQVLQSQDRRRFVFEALRQGTRQAWDHQPFEDASQSYIRTSLTLAELDRRSRFPPSPGRPAG